MSQRDVHLDIEDLWPAADDLVGLQFASETEFARCQAVLAKHLDRYRTTNKWDRLIVVRKEDLPLLQDARLAYTTLELAEADEHPTAEERERQRAALKRYMGLWLRELGWDAR
jgi:hypothetical protein